MKAIVIEAFGGPEVFVEKEVSKPALKPHEVLINVAATSVNPVDYKIRSGLYSATAHAFPAILHGDVAGIVVEVGSGVTRFRAGDEVFGWAGGMKSAQGALAEFMAADQDLIAIRPKNLSMAECAALPLVTITAWEGLIDKAKIQKNQNVLIHAGTGGVGHIALQLAKWKGAKVFVTVSSEEKATIAKNLGADEVIYYRNESVDQYVARCTDGKGFDVVFDTVGGKTLDASMQAVGISGQVVSCQGASNYDLTQLFQKAASLHMVFMPLPLLTGNGRAAHGAIMKAVSELVERSVIRPLVDGHTFSFADVGKAHTLLESGKAMGKVVLTREKAKGQNF